MGYADQTATATESKQEAANPFSDRWSTQILSRRTLLATGATVAAGSAAGCTSVQSALGMGLPSCSGPQRSVPTLAIGATAGQPSVTVTEYVDFECPGCAAYTVDTLPKIKQRFIQSEKIRYVHRDFPVPVGDWSLPVANAVRSIQAQNGAVAAMEASALMFSNGLQADGGYSMDVIAEQARKAGASAERTRQAAEQQMYCEQIKRSRERGSEQGVEGTPTIFVDEKKLEGPSANELVNAIERRL